MYISNHLVLWLCTVIKINSLPFRRSGASSSCSSYYSTSATKAQLLSQMKDFANSCKGDDEDDELTYKVAHRDF